jgi:flagellar hook assembly protein FlgD
MLIAPSVLLIAGILGFMYLRQNRVTLSLSIDQPIFAPGGFADENMLAISLDLSKTARVSLEIIDQQGQTRATILHNRRKMGRRHVFYWNGYDDRGQLLPPGDYTLQAEAGAPPLQVTSAVQIRLERQIGVQAQQVPVYVRTGTGQK